MLRIDMSEVQDLANQFQVFAKRAYPFATKATVNNAAFATQGVARAKVKRDFVTRNRWTVQTVRVAPTRTLRVSQQEARVGSTADYMERQEFGGQIRKRGKKGKPIPTAYAAGQPLRQQPITKLPRRANKLAAIQLQRRQRPKGTRRSRSVAAVRQAQASGKKFVYLDLERSKGIFKIVGKGKRSKIRMVHDLSRPTVTTPRSPWLWPSVQRITPEIPKIHLRALRFQARRNRLFGYG